VADLRNALQVLDGQYRESELVVEGDLLVFLDESGIRGSRNGPYVTVPLVILLVAILPIGKATSLGSVLLRTLGDPSVLKFETLWQRGTRDHGS
jgi:hypothetical protein